ncbi:amidohydrolase family protein [Nocardioides sp. YIM 152315]|uniref:dihydroorotase n=1 Tax=Nocardioides sp. YIM 152315 TaxID=3031760 RepID=UPI0023DCC244|nr:amidohydrolase family protein [Nocardioides sp. YIM 152315]MDF1605830.1 amidohydrolase family protein [Nocardioides sp. YIM 152315]
MATYDLVVRNARIVKPGQPIREGDIAVRNGVIVESDGVVSGDAAQTIDAAGSHVLPGVIDPHTHPGLVAPLDRRLPLESRGAAAGGVTTIVQYLRRPESYREAVPARRKAAEEHLLQDFAFHVTLLNRDHFDDIRMCIEDFGVTSFKIYMNSRMPLSERMRMDALPGQEVNDIAPVDYDDGFLLDAFRALAPYRGVRLNIHCENSDIAISETAKVVAAGRTGLTAWSDGRPAIGEAAAMHVAGVMSREYNVPLYIPHVGSREGIRAVEELRKLGTSLTVETCPHYLVLTDESSDTAKVAPPIRKEADQAAVLEALVRGDLNTLGSDEIPYTLEEKGMSTFWTENTAFSGCGLLLPVAISANLPLQLVAETTSAAPARAFGLEGKGSLDPGNDADLVIVDTESESQVRPQFLNSSSDFSVYDGMSLRGWPTVTISRGEVIFDRGRFPTAEGRGKYLFRSLATD